jgi:hypothetical protein
MTKIISHPRRGLGLQSKVRSSRVVSEPSSNNDQIPVKTFCGGINSDFKGTQRR